MGWGRARIRDAAGREIIVGPTPRHITHAQLARSRKSPNGRPLCCWCDREIPQGSARRRWCSQACVDDYLCRSSSGAARAQVLARDKGVCAECRLDTGRIERIAELLRSRARGFWSLSRWGESFQPNQKLHEARWVRARAWLREHVAPAWRDGSHFWEADHIVPVAEGGGGCGLDGLRTLCLKCHARASAALAKRLAQARRPQRPLPGVQ